MYVDGTPRISPESVSFVTETVQDIMSIAVDILCGGEYSVWQMEDIEYDLEAINGKAVHSQAAER